MFGIYFLLGMFSFVMFIMVSFFNHLQKKRRSSDNKKELNSSDYLLDIEILN